MTALQIRRLQARFGLAASCAALIAALAFGGAND
jgi:hypothetical protein